MNTKTRATFYYKTVFISITVPIAIEMFSALENTGHKTTVYVLQTIIKPIIHPTATAIQ